VAIDCTSAVERLAEPGGLADPEVRGHVALCASCRGAHKALALVQATREEPPSRALAGFAVRVRASHLQTEERTRRVAPLRAALLAGALAATGAATVGLVLDLTFPLVQQHHVAAGARASAPAAEASSSPELLPDDAALEEYASASDSSLFAGDDEDEAAAWMGSPGSL
jgi:hypothetical protein